MKKILMITTGGTIACRRSDRGLSPVLTSEELLAYVPAVSSFCEVTTLALFNIDSTNIRQEHWRGITRAVESHYTQYDGFVICHGTDTMAYTAAALSYMMQNLSKPVVITGSQKPIDMENTDARTNLFDSLLYACSEKAAGVCIVFDGKVIAGTRARKMRTKSYNAFDSINYPHTAVIQDKKVIFYIPPVKAQGSPSFYHNMTDRVCVLKIIPGMKPDILEFLSHQYDAIVLESYGVGGLPEDEQNGFQQQIESLLSKGKTIVMATQVIHEGSDMTVYKVGHMLKKRYQLLESYDMTLESTVTKLMWILGHTQEPEAIHTLFYRTINQDMLYHE